MDGGASCESEFLRIPIAAAEEVIFSADESKAT